MTLEFDDFGRLQLEAAAERAGLTIQEFLAIAARRSLVGRPESRPSGRVPRFRRAFRDGGGGVSELTIRLTLSSEEWRALAADASEQDVTVERLIEHAGLRMLADPSRTA